MYKFGAYSRMHWSGGNPSDELEIKYFEATDTTERKFEIKFTMDIPPAKRNVGLVNIPGTNLLRVTYS